MATTKFLVTSLDSGKSTTLNFGSTVINASVAVQGFDASYGSDDHHIKDINVKTSISSISGSSVSVSATCYIEDDSNHKGNGSVDVLVIALCDS